VFEAHIARGVAVLDFFIPEWRKFIDPDHLDMTGGCIGIDRYQDEFPCGCVLAQVDKSGKKDFGVADYTARELFGEWAAGDLAQYCGFAVPNEMVTPREEGTFPYKNWEARRQSRMHLYGILTQEWKAELAKG
jgi:hypothetical protein